MSIQNNIESLQSILASVNNLPEAGTGTSGVTVQRASGSFTTNTSSTATVTCGFQPDIIIINDFPYTPNSTDYEYQACFCFTERKYPSYTANCFAFSDTYGYGADFELTRTSTGCNVSVSGLDSTWDTITMQRKTFQYVALKYTA